MGRFSSSIAGIAAALLPLAIGCVFSPTAAAQTAPTLANYAKPASDQPLHSKFFDWDALSVRQTPQGQSRAICDNPAGGFDKLEMHSTTLLPGKTLHAPHHHAWEELCFVKEGEVQITLNGKQHKAGPGFLVFFASHDAHSIENVSDKPATYFVINLCAPAARTAVDKPAAEQNVPGKLASTVFDCERVAATSDGNGASAVICNSPTLTLSKLMSQITTLAAGNTARRETAADESQLVLVKDGLMEFVIDGISCRMRAGSFFYCEPRKKLEVKNVGPAQAKYQVIQFAPGAEKSE